MVLLSEIQVKILDRLHAGDANGAIAGAVFLSRPGVVYELGQLFRIARVTNRVQLALWWSDVKARGAYRISPRR